MRQTSRYFSALTEAFLAEGGTVDKFIGDAVMVFWNAPNPQPDHVERACRAALAGKMMCEKLNSQFEAEGLNRDSPDEPLTGVDFYAFAAFWQYGLAARTIAATVGAPNGGRGADLTIFAGIWTHSSRRLPWNA